MPCIGFQDLDIKVEWQICLFHLKERINDQFKIQQHDPTSKVPETDRNILKKKLMKHIDSMIYAERNKFATSEPESK